MKKNSNFKNISYTNFEFISMFIICMFSGFIGSPPERIISSCSSGSVIGILFLAFIFYFIYRVFIQKIFANEYDFYEVIRKTYPPFLQKLFGILLYLLCMIIVYVVICNICLSLKATTYRLSTLFELSIYFLFGLILIVRSGFNAIFRIAGYVGWVLVAYLIILFFLAIPFATIDNFLPLFGEGFKNIFILNLKNINIFSPMFLMLFFGGSIYKHKNRDTIKNYNKIFWFSFLLLLMVIIIFVGLLPSSLLINRTQLTFDISRIISVKTTGIKFEPAVIFIFSIVAFLSSSFVFLIGCMSLERLKVIKDYTHIIILNFILMIIAFMIPMNLTIFNKVLTIFVTISTFICFIFPTITLILYHIKVHPSGKKFPLKSKKQVEVTTYE